MQTIEIDDDVYRYIEAQALTYVDQNPNDTLRRIFELPKDEVRKINGLAHQTVKETPTARIKAPKAKLIDLVRAGFLVDGEELSLVDYRGSLLPGGKASVSGPLLRHAGRRYSMSRLARILLKKNGYDPGSVRGPIHWVNSKGKSVKALWGEYQDQQ